MSSLRKRATPVIERPRRDAQLPTKVIDLGAGLVLFDRLDDLFFGYRFFIVRSPSRKVNWKSHRRHGLGFGGKVKCGSRLYRKIKTGELHLAVSSNFQEAKDLLAG